MADTLQWTRLHPDYLRRIKVSRCDTHLELCMGVCACGEACRLAEISCHAGRVSKWRLNGTGKLFTGFLRCVEVSHDLDGPDVLYMGVRVDCNL